MRPSAGGGAGRAGPGLRAGARTARWPAALLLALGVGLGAGCPLRVPFGERLFFSREAPPPAPQARDCERCHQEVYREWEASGHARAWRSETFQRASAEGRAEVCTGCHAAGPIAAGRAPSLRDAHRAEGVTCTTCHLSPDPRAAPLTMRGPVARTSPVEVHPVIEEDPFYRDSALCGSCHRASLAEWRAAADGDTPTCQGCHMPEVRRTVESVHEDLPYSGVLVALEETLPLRRHLFAVPDDAGDHVDLEATRQGGAETVQVRVRNRLPHALPTGAFGRRQVRLVLRRGGAWASVPLAEAPRHPLAPGETRRLEVAVPGDAEATGEALEVSLERFDHVSGAWQRLTAAPVTAVTAAAAP